MRGAQEIIETLADHCVQSMETGTQNNDMVSECEEKRFWERISTIVQDGLPVEACARSCEEYRSEGIPFLRAD